MLMTSCPPSSMSIDLPGAEFHGMRSAEAMTDANTTVHCYRCAAATTLFVVLICWDDPVRFSGPRVRTTCTNMIKYRITCSPPSPTTSASGALITHSETLFTFSSRRYWQDIVTVAPLAQSTLIGDYSDDIRRPWSHDKIGQARRLCDYPSVIQVKQ
jgi:hypothetical protein